MYFSFIIFDFNSIKNIIIPNIGDGIGILKNSKNLSDIYPTKKIVNAPTEKFKILFINLL